MKTFYLTGFLILATLISPAQSNKFSATLNPFSFFERDGGFTPGIGYNISNRISVYTDLGLIFLSAGNYTGGAIETGRSFGYKIKPAFRYYLSENEIQRGSFLELEGLYKHVTYDATDEVTVTDNNGSFAYTYIGGYKVKKDVYGVSVKYGKRFFLNKQKRLGVDVYAGLGSRTKNFALSGLPTGAQPGNDPFSEDRLFNFFWRRGNEVSVPAGGKLFYNF